MKIIFAFLTVCLLPLCSQAQPKPVIRARILPGANVIVGQPVQLEVDVLVPNYFTGSITYPVFDLQGAIVELSEDRPQHLNEQIGGVSYAGIRQHYVLYSEQPGTFSIPPAELLVPYAASPPTSVSTTLKLPPLQFEASLPEAARNLDSFLPTTQLRLDEKWSPPPQHVHVGDSLSRTVTISARKVQAMLIPPVPFAAPEGVRVYRKNPTVNDQKTDRGEFLRGVRSQTATYLFEKPGVYELPSISVTWWDLSINKLRTSTLPAVKLMIDPTPAYVSELPPAPVAGAQAPSSKRNWRDFVPLISWIAAGLFLVCAVSWVLYRYGGRMRSAYGRARKSRYEAEPAYWRRFQRACKNNDAPQAYSSFLAWLRRAEPEMTVDRFQSSAADAFLDRELHGLSHALFAGKSEVSWSGSNLESAVAKTRHSAEKRRRKKYSLPPLNPVASFPRESGASK
jgi:hypothetical protein